MLEPSHSTSAQPDLSNSKILVVDDVPTNIKMVGTMLRKQGYQVLAATSGQNALDSLEKQLPDLILLDMMMPKMDGREVLRRILESPSWKDIPVIFLTAAHELEDLVEGFQMGAVDYITKPFHAEELFARVKTHLRLKYFREELQRTNHQLEEELQSAADYVLTSLPKPIQKPVKIDWFFKSCSALGGDSFGYQEMPNGSIALFFLDVSGHGVKASLLATSVSRYVKSELRKDPKNCAPEKMMKTINEAFRITPGQTLFFTFWYGVLNPETRELKFCNAGNPHPILITSGELPNTLQAGGMLIGLLDEAQYPVETTTIPEGSKLYLLSDGVFEIPTVERRMDFPELMEWVEIHRDELLNLEGDKDLHRLHERALTLHQTGELDDDFSILRIIT